MSSIGEPEPVIYRTGGKMAKRKSSKEAISEQALCAGEDMPSVRLLRELEAQGWAELEARGLTPEERKLRDLYLETRRRAS